jgi:hypothetical protein
MVTSSQMQDLSFSFCIYFEAFNSETNKWKTPPTQQRFKNNKVYECHPDVKFSSIKVNNTRSE